MATLSMSVGPGWEKQVQAEWVQIDNQSDELQIRTLNKHNHYWFHPHIPFSACANVVNTADSKV